jgi:hypothetical protein
MTRDQGDLLDADTAARRTDAALHDARAALRRVDTLAAAVRVLEDEEVATLVAESQGRLEQVVRQLTRRHQDDRQRAKAAIRGR